MTAAERRAVLDARLEEGYGVFDGMILSEREKVQRQTNEAGSGVMSGNAGGAGDGGETGDFGGIPGGVIVASANGSAAGGPGAPIGGVAASAQNNNTPTFPVPDDIPGGNDDDVVARQLREAALHEPDPELREKLWDEYRRYTGLPAPAQPQ